MTAHDTRRNAGFTLIELLVALALAALVSLLLMRGIGVAALGFDRISRAAERLDESRGADQVLRHALASAAAISSGGAGIGFSGDAAHIAFLSLVSDAGSGIFRVEIALNFAGGDRRVVLTRQRAGTEAALDAQRSILAHGVRSFRISYYGAPKLGEEPAWQDRWDGLGYLPKLIRVELETADEPGRPPLIVRVWNAG